MTLSEKRFQWNSRASMLREAFGEMRPRITVARRRLDLWHSHGMNTSWGSVIHYSSKLIEIYSPKGPDLYTMAGTGHPIKEDEESSVLTLIRRLENDIKKWMIVTEALKEDLEAEWLSKTRKKHLGPVIEAAMGTLRTFQRDLRDLPAVHGG